MAKKIPQRQEISKEYLWALEDLYPSLDAWEADFLKLKSMVDTIGDYRGKLSQKASWLLEYMQFNDQLSVLCDRLANYAQRKNDEDTRISHHQALVARLMT